ncbi:UbiA family prenyltransferase [Henriciella sp. AS95]|uniref:UbiA family prenyltransferase n=1 Tax=Henriciella sp. AS95 TaxID=3135782 RepID=UPI003170503C
MTSEVAGTVTSGAGDVAGDFQPETSANETSALEKRPLIVDLDGTLIRSDILVESAFALLGKNPFAIFSLVTTLFGKGKAGLKNYVADRSDIDIAHLPYEEEVLAVIRQARDEGRAVYLASASHEKYVGAIADHLGLFDGWFATNDKTNLSGSAKRQLLVDKFGAGGFDYIGNEAVDLKVWADAHDAIAVNPPSSVKSKLKKRSPQATIIETLPSRLKTWIKMLRVHQWAKNGLVMVPLLTSQNFDVQSVLLGIGAFFAFSLTASSIYIINDAVDIDADRQHPSKKFRPLAAGTMPILSAVMAIPVMLTIALVGAWFINPIFLAVLVGYLCLTTAYTFSLKRKLLVDVVALAGLYTVRVLGGAAALSLAVSEWLLAFSLFVFTCLALIKRYTELVVRFDNDMPDPTNRNYRKSDLPIIATLAAAAGFNAVTVFALYVSDDEVASLYANPLLLWLICPLLLYWLGRALMLAHRRAMHDDPIVFALKDRNSRLTMLAVAAVMVAAMVKLPFTFG